MEKVPQPSQPFRAWPRCAGPQGGLWGKVAITQTLEYCLGYPIMGKKGNYWCICLRCFTNLLVWNWIYAGLITLGNGQDVVFLHLCAILRTECGDLLWLLMVPSWHPYDPQPGLWDKMMLILADIYLDLCQCCSVHALWWDTTQIVYKRTTCNESHLLPKPNPRQWHKQNMVADGYMAYSLWSE